MERPTPVPGDKRPRFDILIIEVENYVSLGMPGYLRLEFFNDRLKDTKFFPLDLETYKHRLAAKIGLELDSNRSTLPPRTVVKIGKTVQGEDFIIFRDSYLQDELECWVIEYS